MAGSAARPETGLEPSVLRIQLGSHFGKMNNLDLLFSEFLERNPHPGVTYFYIAVDMEKEYMKRRLRICNTIYAFMVQVVRCIFWRK